MMPHMAIAASTKCVTRERRAGWAMIARKSEAVIGSLDGPAVLLVYSMTANSVGKW
jgi:hypothetical protein